MKTNTLKKFVLLIFLFTLCFNQPIHADVGNTGGFGGGSSSGSSSSDYDSYDNFYSSKRKSSDDGSLTLLIIGNVLIFGFLILINSGNNANARVSKPSSFNYQHTNESKVIDELIAKDPTFSVTQFKSLAEKNFLGVQRAWSNLSTQSMRPLTTNTLYRSYEVQIADLIRDNHRNVLNQQKVADVTITHFQILNDQEIIQVRINASLVDYVINRRTEELISGDKTFVFERAYAIEFVRNIETKQDPEAAHHCPNCGAVLYKNPMNECENCRIKIVETNTDWLMNRYDAWIWS